MQARAWKKSEICIIACGPKVPEALRATYILKKEHGIETRVINMHTVKPLDEMAIKATSNEIGKIVTAEEHQKGGVGNQIAGVITRAGLNAKISMIGVDDKFGESAQPWELIWKYELAAEHIVKAALLM